MRSRTKPLGLGGVLVYGSTLFGYLSVWSAPVCAQTYVFGRADFPTGQGPVAMATGDFNEDGILDVVVVNSIDNAVSILLGQRNGTLGLKTDFPVGKSPSAVAVGDFNTDGKADLAVTNSEDGTVSILLGNGDGTFQGAASYATSKGPSSLVAVDLNLDGKLDLAVANLTDNSLSILLGNGDGSFGPHSDFAAATSPTAVVAGDFNGDGKLDLVVAGASASILLGNGDGTFASAASIFQGSGPESVAAADINGDGKLDLVIADATANQVSYLIGNGDGTFAFSYVSASGTAPSAVVIGDFNGDGKPDFATADKGSNTVSVALQSNPVNYSVFPQISGYPAGPSPTALALADFNGDGKIDLAVTSLSSNSIAIILGRGDGAFELTNTSIGYDVRGVVMGAGDFNGDGRLDLVIATAYPSTDMTSWLSNGDDSFNVVSSGLGFDLAFPGALATADFNADGMLDLATNNGGYVSIFLGNGDGTFTVAGSGGGGAVGGLGPSGVATGDFNRDGKADVAAINDSGVQVLLGDGDGNLRPAVTYPAGTQPAAVAVGDFNGDGKLDLAVTNSNCEQYPSCGPGSVSILLGNRDGTFQPHVDYATGADPTSVVVGDFNNDGWLDLAVGNAVSQTVSVLLGNGDGSFQPHVDYPVPCSTCSFSSLGAADFNADGKLDLALSNGGTGLSVLFGNGDGTFAIRKQYYSCESHISQYGMPPPVYICFDGIQVVAGDFKGNGASDVAFTATGGGPYPPSVETTFTVLTNGPVIALSPPALAFAGQTVGTTSAGQQVAVSNPGVGLLNISNISASGDFAQTNDCPSGLPAGGTCTITVTFTPTVSGTRTGTLTITDSAPGSPQLVPLVGNAPVVSLSPTVVNFGRQGITTTSSAQAITLANMGTSTLNITSIAVTGPNGSEFTQTNKCPASLALNTSCAIEVTFSPGAPGVRVGAVSITDNAAGSPHVVPLSGTGALVGLSPPSLTFAGQNVGTTSKGQIVTLTNHGSTPLSLTNVAATGDFRAINACLQSIRPEGTCKIVVQFKPTQTGVRNGTLTISYNEPGSPQIVALTGTGTMPAVSLSAASLTFGGQLVGTSSTSQTVTLTNIGDGPLSINNITTSGDFALTPSQCAGSVPAGAGCEIGVVFKPQAGGDRTGTLSINDNAADSPQSVSLSGEGQDFTVSASTTSATVTAGQTANYTLSLASEGGFSGGVSFTCTGAPSTATCSLTPSSVTLAASGTTAVTVRVATTARSVALPAGRRRPLGLGSLGVWLLCAWLIVVETLDWMRPGMATPRRGLLRVPLGAALLFVALWAGCGASGPPPATGTHAGTYPLAVTASGSGLTKNVSLTLFVN